jgi:hypothetical protein
VDNFAAGALDLKLFQTVVDHFGDAALFWINALIRILLVIICLVLCYGIHG